MEKITLAKPLDNYRIEIHTAAGYRGVFDVKPYLDKGIFRELKEQAYFNLVRPAHHGIGWPRGQDFSADTILWDIEHIEQSCAAGVPSRAGHDQRTNAIEATDG